VSCSWLHQQKLPILESFRQQLMDSGNILVDVFFIVGFQIRDLRETNTALAIAGLSLP
jgi:hypothetical protein